MTQVIRQMLVIRQRFHSKDYWLKVLVPVFFLGHIKYFLVASDILPLAN